ncbi:DUF397 domain-containing protein [Streptomyces aurantiacus]|uniref:DUF397 domain-containing protein n=1 Tax=Streptomyces aurantiacus TaxID=47760 RepID=UPI0006E34C2B|nr:DUF397 domain-containing protein [Streptomyces aurantiacus]
MSTSETTWLKSSYSGGGGDNCIEITHRPGVVLVRDSKDIQKQALAVSRDAWSAFTGLAADSRV